MIYLNPFQGFDILETIIQSSKFPECEHPLQLRSQIIYKLSITLSFEPFAYWKPIIEYYDYDFS